MYHGLHKRLFSPHLLMCCFISLLLLTIDDLLPFGLLLAQVGQSFRGGLLPPVGRVLLELKEAWLHLLQLWGGAGGGGARPLKN